MQACQAAPAKLTENLTSKDPLPIQFSDPYNDQHVSLCRPNTVLLLATVRGGVVVRGLFLKTIRKAISAADGKSDIYDMFNQAAAEVIAQYSYQHPEFESVTDKKLILPPVRTHYPSFHRCYT